jgi:hypothetical protein
MFDSIFIRKISPAAFNKFSFLPSRGASGRSIVIWKGNIFDGEAVFTNEYAQSIMFTSLLSGASWLLTNVYAPCTDEGKRMFTTWFRNIQMLDNVDWLVVGDFNLIRKAEDRNKPGANANEIFMFNEAISALGLVEISLKGRTFTWTNKQTLPLLERLDWFFSSISWTSNYPNTVATSLAMQAFDHAPCIIHVNTNIPRAKTFRFENYWMEHNHFLQVVQHGWSIPVTCSDPAKIIMAKFKNLRRVLRSWQQHISSLSLLMEKIKVLLQFMEILEEYRDLSVQEWNFKAILKEKLSSLLDQQRIYWKQRANVKSIKFGDGNIKFFHANATIKFRKNSIAFLHNSNGELISEHSGKADLLWEAYKDRLGISELANIQCRISWKDQWIFRI